MLVGLLRRAFCQRAVLIAIAIPTFTGQLEKSREATDKANLRAAYSEVVTKWLADGQTTQVKVKAQQTAANWQSEGEATSVKIAGGIESTTTTTSTGGGTVTSTKQSGMSAGAVVSPNEWTVAIGTDGTVTCTPSGE